MITHHVDILILGAGWTSDFLIPLLTSEKVSFAATTRDGRVREGMETIKFEFNVDTPAEDGVETFKVLPDAKTVLVTFPIRKLGGSEKLVDLWKKSHEATRAGFVQLGSSGIWNGDPTMHKDRLPTWLDRNSPFDTQNERARVEEELLGLDTPSTVLNLSGLWGGQRHPRHWVERIAATKEALASKQNIHLIHGEDVSRAVLAVHLNFNAAAGQRWMLSDCRSYDWWHLASSWPVEGKHALWVQELMADMDVRALPRPMSAFERVLDTREFWTTFGLSPSRTLLCQ